MHADFDKGHEVSSYPSFQLWHYSYMNNSLHLVQKYAQVFVRGYYKPVDSSTRMRTSARFDCLFLAKILRKFKPGRLILPFVSDIGCSVILIDGNWAFSWSKYAETAFVLVTWFDTTTFLQNVPKWLRYHVFPAKVTLLCACSLLFYQKISYL